MTTLRTLECLVALVDTGSVTGAAAALRMSQPALSHQIAALEKELGTPVVQRLGRGVRVTAAGLAAAQEARIALRAADQAVHKGRQVGTGMGGRLRIACAETMTTWLLVPVLRQWRSRRPEVVLVAPTGHRFADASSVSFADLDGEPFVHYAPDNGLAVWLDELAGRANVVLDPVLRTRSPRTAVQLAAAGMGVTIAPLSALTPRPAGIVRPLEPALRRDVVVVVASPSDTLAARFVADLRRRGLPGQAASGGL